MRNRMLKGNKFILVVHQLFENVSNYFPLGIGPTNWFWERFKTSRKFRLVSSAGIFPSSIVEERSNDSRFVKFPKERGIGPMRLLCDRLRLISA
ncbi:hypothetical protein HN873_067615 [Arachis hypogaea]|uniref:Uncharacterized protein n=1 Tax=Arachis hypogaea TaxID=3818 RepID=A0A6B9VDG9_ARAHY|nr:uncharacterized protein DS421_19g658970 [Arachis hypogaea]